MKREFQRRGEFPPVSTVFFSSKARGRVWINNLVSSWIFLPRNLSRRTELFAVVQRFYEHFFPVLVNFPDTCFLEISNYLRLFNRDYPRWRDDPYLKYRQTKQCKFRKLGVFTTRFCFFFFFFLKSFSDNVNVYFEKEVKISLAINIVSSTLLE